MKDPERSTSPRLSLWFFAGFSVLFLALVIPGIRSNSLTNDEPVEITNGYYSLTRGDVAASHNYSPFATAFCALPLLGLPLRTLPLSGDVFDRAQAFLFVWNLDQLAWITPLARMGNLILGLLLGFFLYQATGKERVLSFFVLFLWALNPTLLSLSGLTKTDMPGVVLFFLTVCLFQKTFSGNLKLFSLSTGLALAAAVTSKFSCLILIPVFLLMEILDFKKGGARERAGLLKQRIFWVWGGGIFSFFLAVFFIYLPAALYSSGHRFPLVYFFEKFRELTLFDQKPYPVYFWGEGGFQNHWFYFPAVFILKSPIPFLLFLLTGLFLGFRRRLTFPVWLWAPPLGIFLSMLPHLNEGIRFLAPALPFTFIIAAQGAAWCWTRKSGDLKFKIPVLGLLIWQLLSVGSCFPSFLSYFNDGVSPERKIFFLADSNLDWGQDLKRLAGVAQKRHWPRVKLAYFGGVDPAVYGLNWEPWRVADLESPRPGAVYAVNTSFFQLAPVAYPPTKVIVESWLAKELPTGKVADSWYYFEIPGKNKKQKSTPYLASAPFLQYRGYAAFPLGPTGPE